MLDFFMSFENLGRALAICNDLSKKLSAGGSVDVLMRFLILKNSGRF